MTATVSGRPRLSMRDQDGLIRSAVRALVTATDALVNPPTNGLGNAIALLNAGTALYRIAQLDVDEAAKVRVLAALERIREVAP